jgi:hypothetical protein
VLHCWSKNPPKQSVTHCSDARARLFLFQTAIPYRASSQLKHVFEETGDVSPKTRSPAQVTQGFFLRATTAMHNSPLDDGQIKVMRCPYCGYESRKMLAWAQRAREVPMCWLRRTAHFPQAKGARCCHQSVQGSPAKSELISPCVPRHVLATTARKQSTLRGDTTAVTSFFW